MIAAWALLIACAAHAPAAAQVLDNYFSETGLPAGGIPADQSRAAATAAYTPLGIHVGNVVINPTISESGGFDSNVAGLNRGSSPIIDTSASLVARTDAPRYSLSAELGVQDVRYTAQPQQDTTSWNASIGGTYAIGHDTLGLSYDHLNQVQTAGQIGSATTQPVPYRVDVLSGSYTAASFGRISLMPGFELRDYSFDPVALPGTSTTEAVRDRTSAQESLVARYELSPQRNLLVALSGTEISYSHATPGLPALDSTGGSVLAGLDYAASGVFRYRVLAGYQIRQYRAGIYHSLSAPIVEAAVTYAPTRLTTLILSARRDIEDSLSEAVTGFTYTSARLDITHELRRNIQIAAYTQVQFAGSSQLSSPTAAIHLPFGAAGANQTLYGAGASISYKWNRNVQFTASESFTTRTGAGTADYQENVAMLCVSVAL